MDYLFATTNKAKVRRYGEKLKENGIQLVTLNDLNLELDVDESGKNPIENAIIKATAYNKATNMTTIAIDDGLFLDNVPDEVQPGTHVRRVNGKRLNDEEITETELYQEIDRAKAIAGVAAQIINNGQLVLKAQKLKKDYIGEDKKLPPMLEG